jgi:hypothetical protein
MTALPLRGVGYWRDVRMRPNERCRSEAIAARDRRELPAAACRASGTQHDGSRSPGIFENERS